MRTRTDGELRLEGPRCVSPSDLRKVDCSPVLRHVQDVLGVWLDDGSVVRKRRTIGGRTTRDTWLRIEVRGVERVRAQGWGGIESAAALRGIAKPDWYQSISWRDPRQDAWWRADETQLVRESVIKAGGPLHSDPGLSPRWWHALGGSLAALAGQPTGRYAKLGTGTTCQEHLTELVDQSARLLGVGPLDSQAPEWTTAHADLTWANLTAPELWVLDWEDWGRAPRGFDATSVLLSSLTIPALAAQVRRTFDEDLATRSAQVALLAQAADLLADPEWAGSVYEPARREALRAAEQLIL